MIDPLIFDIIKVGVQSEISNPYSITDNAIRIRLADGTEVELSTKNNSKQIYLENLQSLKDYLHELLLDNFVGIDIDENFVCKLKDFPDTKVEIIKM